MREQVEALEDHADVRALTADVPGLHLVENVALLTIAHQLAGDPEPAGVDLLQVVDAAQQRRLATTRRAEQHVGLLWHDLQVDALEHVELAESLPDLLRPDHGLADERRIGRRLASIWST